MASLQKLSFLIDTAANRNSELSAEPIQVVAAGGGVPDLGGAKGRTEKEIAEVLEYRLQQRERFTSMSPATSCTA